ncbi:hypothetical protein [Natronococcus occultus]|uniref:Uncharacterized protein n=1 Tax=Natronococcus occultus SP4 TaxID=694430 RepID=L0JY70_9EURY|nr:hypothetical protein [Natronococcus occultus]AGB37992.1 hypothetical protein Natoc_2213 [Natronococcus occultus SP4]
MTSEHEHDHDLQAEELEELADDPMDAAREIAGESARDGRLAVVSGGLMLLSTLRSVARGQLRAIPKAAIGAGLVGIGLRQRQAAEPTTFEPDLEEVEDGTDGKETSDQAAAAAERPDAGQESQIDADGDVDEEAQLGEAADDDEGEIEFTDDPEDEEPRTKPDADTGTEDPRRDTDGETTEVDVSDTAMAEETAEATGPDPEQAQPAQTDAIEPEETPEEDASDKKVEPDDEDDED